MGKKTHPETVRLLMTSSADGNRLNEMENVMNQYATFETSVNVSSAHAGSVVGAYECVQHLADFYPDFHSWYWGTVVPGLGVGTRLLETVVRDGKIAAVLIAKRDADERKLCTLWVDPKFAGSGIGVRLIKAGCAWVGTDTPLATVPEERMAEFADILPRLGFKLTQVADSYYRNGKAEYVFNGQLIKYHA